MPYAFVKKENVYTTTPKQMQQKAKPMNQNSLEKVCAAAKSFFRRQEGENWAILLGYGNEGTPSMGI